MRLVLAIALVLLALPGRAETPEKQPDDETAAPLDPKLQEELERALKEDKAAQEKQQPAAPQAPAVPSEPSGERGIQSFNPDLSLIGDFALAGFTEPRPRMIGGHDPRENGFNLQSVELALGAAVDPYLRMDANLAFGPEGEFEIEEAYATSLALPANLQVRAGQMLARFGRINPTHPHAWEFADQPLVIGKFLGPDGLRGPAGEVSVLLPLPWYVEAVLSGQNPRAAPSFYGESGRVPHTAADLVYMGALKQFFALSDDWALAWGFSALAGPNDEALHGRTEIYGTDLYLKYRPVGEASSTVVSLTVEGLARRRHTYDSSGNSVGTPLVDGGMYAQLFWKFAQRWGVGLRGDYVSGVSDDPVTPEWTESRYRISGAVTFWPTEFSRLRLQGNHDRALFEEKAVDSVYLAFEFAAGAHGAHAF